MPHRGGFLTRAMLASAAIIAVVVCLSVCLSVTRRCSTERAKRSTTERSHTVAQGRQISDAENRSKTQTGSLQTEAPNAAGVG